MVIRTAVVNGQDKGEVYYRNGSWRWDLLNASTSYDKNKTLEDVRAHIASYCCVPQRDVKLQERAR